MVTPIEMKQKTLFRGLLEISKKSRNSQKCGKLSKLHHSEVGEFWTMHKRTYWSNCKIFQMGLYSFYPNLFMTLLLTHKSLALVIFYFYDLYLNFITFNSKINYIKYENLLFFQMSWIYIFLNVQESPRPLPNS